MSEPRTITKADAERARRVFKTIPFVQLIGMQFVSMSDGETVIKLEMREQLRQPHGLLHGGATASLIDTAMAFAVITRLAKDEKASTVDLTVHYLRPVTEGEIVCTAKVVRSGRKILTVSADVINDKGKMIATALSTYAKV